MEGHLYLSFKSQEGERRGVLWKHKKLNMCIIKSLRKKMNMCIQQSQRKKAANVNLFKDLLNSKKSQWAMHKYQFEKLEVQKETCYIFSWLLLKRIAGYIFCKSKGKVRESGYVQLERAENNTNCKFASSSSSTLSSSSSPKSLSSISSSTHHHHRRHHLHQHHPHIHDHDHLHHCGQDESNFK